MPLYALGARAPQLPQEGRYWVAPDAHIIGDVRLGEDVGIWFGAVARGDNEPIVIGAGSNIQEHVMLHTDMGSPLTLGAYCTIGHGAIIHGCQIGDETLIGMGATILNGAVIGRQCLVGAGALVTEGKHFPERSLIVGSPARVIRPLTEAEVSRLRLSAENYIKNAHAFRQNLRVL